MTAQETAPWLFDASRVFTGDDRFGGTITFQTEAPQRMEQKVAFIYFVDRAYECFVSHERIAAYCEVDLYWEGRYLRTFYAASDNTHKAKLAAERAFGFQLDYRIRRISQPWQSPKAE